MAERRPSSLGKVGTTGSDRLDDREKKRSRQVLKGSLDDFGVEDVLWLVDRTKRTGELRIERPTTSGRLFFRDGLLYAAEAGSVREPLGAQLVRSGLIGRAQLADAESRSTDGSSPARALLATGALHEEQLTSAYEGRLVEATFDLMRREFGEFTWEADAKTEPEVDSALPVARLLDLCRAKHALWEEIKSVIPSERAVPAISKSPSRDPAAITVSAEQWRLLSAVDGTRTVQDVAQDAGLNDFTVLRALHDLAARGLLEVLEVSEVPVRTRRPAPPGPPAPSTTTTKPFTIVLMCTANRIRSPLAESFLRAHLGDLPARVESVGVEGWEGQPAMPEAAEVALELGGDLSAHSARPLSAVDLSTADLVLGFESRHVKRAISDGNAPPERTFTLPQFVKCLERADTPDGDDLVARARAAVGLAHEQRSHGTGGSRRTREIEIVDPLGGPKSAYRNTALRIRELCKRVSLGLFGATSV